MLSVYLLYISNELTSLVPDLAQMDTSSSSGSISSMPDWVLRASWDTRQLYCSSQTTLELSQTFAAFHSALGLLLVENTNLTSAFTIKKIC